VKSKLGRADDGRTCRGCGGRLAKRHLRGAGLCPRCQDERAALIAEKLATLDDTQSTPQTPENRGQRPATLILIKAQKPNAPRNFGTLLPRLPHTTSRPSRPAGGVFVGPARGAASKYWAVVPERPLASASQIRRVVDFRLRSVLRCVIFFR
jgi:hypothetical protein